jgi:hypothetical protein
LWDEKNNQEHSFVDHYGKKHVNMAEHKEEEEL